VSAGPGPGPSTTTDMGGMPGMAPAGHAVTPHGGSGGGAMSMAHQGPITLHQVLTVWQISPWSIAVTVVLAGMAAWYLVSVRRLAARGRRWHGWRTASFVAGLITVEIALCSSVAVLAMDSFTAHVIQHLLLMILAPPLAALGAPMTLLLQSSGRPTKRRALAALHSRPFAVVRHPITVFFLYYLSMYAFFLTPALQYAMQHMWVMDVINVGFLLGATLFWWPMVGVDPIPRGRMNPGFKLVNLIVGIPIESFLGIAILLATSPVASMYTLASTHTGGGVLWAASEFATIIALVPIFVEWSRADERAGRRLDAQLDAGRAPAVAGQGMAATFRSLRRD
jgi:cytochrome c oxidase assembly factor CtaG